MKERYDELSGLVNMPEIMAHGSQLRKMLKELASLKDIAEKYELLLLETNGEEELAEDIAGELNRLIRERENKTGKNAVVEIKANEGSDESKRFALTLADMYRKFADEEGLAFLAGADGSALKDDFDGRFAAYISGGNAYAKLCGETGLHKTVGKNGVSATVTVLPEKEKPDFNFDEKDIKIDVFHSGGAGGQHINKVETAVRIKHVPTGITVTCQDERSQLKNKYRALLTLKDRVYQESILANDREYEKVKKDINAELKKGGRKRVYDFSKNIVNDGSGKAADLKSVLNGEIKLFSINEGKEK
jgi:peptide chain release factor 1